MEISWSYEGKTGLELIAVMRLPDLDCAELVEAIREGTGKNGRDVLSDDHPGAVFGKVGQYSADGVCSACRGTDRDDGGGRKRLGGI
jgi:hypothetical protein